MEGEGYLEFSLGALPQVVRGSRREGLTFPLVLQVLDSTEGRRFGFDRHHPTSLHPTSPRKIITVSDGFYSKVDCFWLEGSHPTLELYSVIKVHNIDFDHSYERGRDLPRIAGRILDFTVVKAGSEIGYFSGKPVKLRDRDNGRGAENHLLQDSLSQKLWKQVKQERFCDVTFSFPNAVGPGGQVVKAQKTALIANSPVFEAQFEGGFSDASSSSVPIEDTQPKYMRCLLQFIFTRFLPLLSLRQAFEMLYLAKKYLIEDLEAYCKNFILNNKQTLAGVTNVFLCLEMNVKNCDDDISQFVWAQLRSKAAVYIRQPQFLELDFATVENFLAEPDINCQEWELAQALRRWVVANEFRVKCDLDSEAPCPHQLLESIRWRSVALQEAVVVASWPEFRVQELDATFLTDQLELQQQEPLAHSRALPELVQRQYSHNRLHCTRDDFVVYTSLAVSLEPGPKVSCQFGREAHRDTVRDTHCSSMGPPFQLLSHYIVPSYGLRSRPVSARSQPTLEVMVNLASSARLRAVTDSFTSDPRAGSRMKAQVTLTAFSFSPLAAGRVTSQVVEFLSDWDSCHTLSLTFSQQELVEHYTRQEVGLGGQGRTMDLQLQLCTDLSHLTGQERVSPVQPAVMRSSEREVRGARREARQGRWERCREDEHRRINSVGRTMQRLRCREGLQGVAQDGWGDVARSPQWRGGRTPSPPGWVHLDQVAYGDEGGGNREGQHGREDRGEQRDNTIEIEPEARVAPEAFGDITRSPQSPSWQGEEDSPTYSPLSPNYRTADFTYRDSPLSPQQNRYSNHGHGRPWEANSRSPSPQPGPSHRWDTGASRDPRRTAPRHPATSGRLPEPGLSLRPSALLKAVEAPAAPQPPAPRPPSPHRFSLSPGSNEAAVGSRPGSGGEASPPRNPYSPIPILYLRHSPGEGSPRPSSPAYLPPSPHSPDVIDIDMEETGQVGDSPGVEQEENISDNFLEIDEDGEDIEDRGSDMEEQELDHDFQEVEQEEQGVDLVFQEVEQDLEEEDL